MPRRAQQEGERMAHRLVVIDDMDDGVIGIGRPPLRSPIAG